MNLYNKKNLEHNRLSFKAKHKILFVRKTIMATKFNHLKFDTIIMHHL